MSALEVERTVDERLRLLVGIPHRRPATIREHVAHHGALDLRGVALPALLEESGLRGRGGAAFPVAAKLRAVAAGRKRPVVVVNGAEGEPLSRKDSVLLRRAPHLVLDGAVALAAALDARDVVVAFSESDEEAGRALAGAIEERRGLHDRIAVRPAAVPERLVAGQETALVQFLNGGPALPTFTPPRPFERGVGRRPTLVQNVETAAQVALIVRNGAGWFRQAGTPTEPGTALFTVSGAVARPGVFELPFGTPLRDLLAAAGGVTRTPRAFLVGGYAGAWIDASAARGLTLEEAALQALGGTLGVGSVAVLPDGICGLCESARVARFLADESAGQCGPCVHGLASVAASLEAASAGRLLDRALLGRRFDAIGGRGACRHPDGALRFVASAVRVFEPELVRHAGRRCSNRANRILPLPQRGGR